MNVGANVFGSAPRNKALKERIVEKEVEIIELKQKPLEGLKA